LDLGAGAAPPHTKTDNITLLEIQDQGDREDAFRRIARTALSGIRGGDVLTVQIEKPTDSVLLIGKTSLFVVNLVLREDSPYTGVLTNQLGVIQRIDRPVGSIGGVKGNELVLPRKLGRGLGSENVAVMRKDRGEGTRARTVAVIAHY
jgi:hypothetical protein